MAGPVIRPFFATLEKGLDLNPLLGELVSNKLVSQNKMKELNEMKSTKQNRAFFTSSIISHRVVRNQSSGV